MISFLQPFFLLALAGLAVPVLIHRISRARPRAWRFPSIRLIQPNPLPRHGRRSLTDLLLLALRLALLAAFILALAGPSWTPAQDAGSPTSNERRLGWVLLDHSRSMDGWGAPDDIREVLDALGDRPVDDWGWVSFASTIKASKSPDISGNLNDLRDWMQGTPAFEETGDPENAIRQLPAFFNEARLPAEIHIISDFQSSNWRNLQSPLPAGMEVHLHPVGSRNRGNNLSLASAYTVPRADEGIRIVARVMNHGAIPASAEVRLSRDNRHWVEPASMDPMGLTTVAFDLPSGNRQSQLRLELRADGDPFSRDNSLMLDGSAPPPLEVFALGLRPSLGVGAEEVFFLGQALETDSPEEWRRYSVTPVGLDPLQSESLARAAAVFVPAEMAAQPGIPWSTLIDFAEQGGLVVVTLDETAVRTHSNLATGPWASIAYRGLAGRGMGSRFFMGPLPESSPLKAVFEGPAERDLFLLSLRQYAQLTVPPEAQSFLVTESGDPLLFVLPTGEGHLAVSAFPWNREADHFPLRPSFLPIVREVFALARSPVEDRNTASSISALAAESLPADLDPDEILERLRGASPETGNAAQAAIPSTAANQRIELWPWLILAAGLFWLAESLLAWRLLRPA